MNARTDGAEHRLLEQVTGAASPALAELNEEAVALREGWVQLGQLLEAAGAPVDEPKLVQQVRARLQRRCRPFLWRRSLQWSLTAAAMVLAALLGLGGGSWQSAASRDPGLARLAVARLPARNELTRAQAAWEDPLETDFNSLHQGLALLQQEWQNRTTPFDLVRQRLEQLETEFAQSPL